MTWVSAVFKVFPLRVWLTLAAVLAVSVLLFAYCESRKAVGGLTDQATVDEARRKSAEDAVDAVADNAFMNHKIREEARLAQDAIRQADPADRDTVARRELCKLQGGAAC